MCFETACARVLFDFFASPTLGEDFPRKWLGPVSMTLEKWVHDPFILGNDPFVKGHGDSRCVFFECVPDSRWVLIFHANGREMCI